MTGAAVGVWQSEPAGTAVTNSTAARLSPAPAVWTEQR